MTEQGDQSDPQRFAGIDEIIEDPGGALDLIADLRAELDDFKALVRMQHRRVIEADRLYQREHDWSETMFPDLGELVQWLLNERQRLSNLYAEVLHASVRVAAEKKATEDALADYKRQFDNDLVFMAQVAGRASAVINGLAAYMKQVDPSVTIIGDYVFTLALLDYIAKGRWDMLPIAEREHGSL